MKRSVFEAIVDEIARRREWNFTNCVSHLCNKFPDENPEAIRSIVSQR